MILDSLTKDVLFKVFHKHIALQVSYGIKIILVWQKFVIVLDMAYILWKEDSCRSEASRASGA